MHVYRVRDLVSARVYIYTHTCSQNRGGGRVYEIKTLRSNLAPEEGRGHLFEGAYNQANTVLAFTMHALIVIN